MLETGAPLPSKVPCFANYDRSMCNVTFTTLEHWEVPAGVLCHPKPQQKDIDGANAGSELEKRGCWDVGRHRMKPQRVVGALLSFLAFNTTSIGLVGVPQNVIDKHFQEFSISCSWRSSLLPSLFET